MKTKTLLLFLTLWSCTLCAQTQFFKSNIAFTEKHLSGFFSSVTVNAGTVYFVANDYAMYSFDKSTGKQNWKSETSSKTSRKPFIMGDTLIAGFYDFKTESTKAVLISTKTGDTLKTLPFEPPHTLPYFKNGILYCTTIYNAGQLIAYDIKKDTVVWARFVAHGVDTQPVYLKDKIIANAEDTNWFEMDYNNKLLGKCNNPAPFVEDITCIENYRMLTHDGKKLDAAFFEKYFSDEYAARKTYFTGNNTFIMNYKTLLVVEKKAKVKHNVNIDDIIYNLTDAEGQSIEIKFSEYYDILKADDTSVWLISNNILVVLNIKTGKATKTYNITQWAPHQAVLDGTNLWLINSIDGQLYGLKLD
ncbi:MAG: PQQ-binding-like beta-propeller repeat protein [Bacteroidota bacterium]